MASIPGAVFKTCKIHDEISRFRKRSASSAPDHKEAALQLEPDAFRQRSASMTTPSTSAPSTPVSGLSPAISGESLRNFVGGFMGSLNVLRPKQTDSSLESVNEDFPALQNYPNAGSVTDLVHMKWIRSGGWGSTSKRRQTILKMAHWRFSPGNMFGYCFINALL